MALADGVGHRASQRGKLGVGDALHEHPPSLPGTSGPALRGKKLVCHDATDSPNQPDRSRHALIELPAHLDGQTRSSTCRFPAPPLARCIVPQDRHIKPWQHADTLDDAVTRRPPIRT
ncbi:hypothetical protein SDC9_159373 [bioreactor metagenome]|uniref:Uncharacterized protein n=1 Tax=bioreactor metagenome TaxID=1076179 RepID=A0A645FIJ5_9ZZZZ